MGSRFVSFGIGRSRWCLPVASVVQIVRHENVHDLPHAQPPVAGVITLHSDVIPVVDLRERLEAGEPSAGSAPRAEPRAEGAASAGSAPRAEPRAEGAASAGSAGEAGPGKRRILVARLDGRPYGILVDEVRELVDLDETPAVGAPTALPAFAAGYGLRGGEMLPILDLARALGSRPP